MQRHKSVEKRARTSEKAREVNKMGRSKVKTVVRTVLEAKDKESASNALKAAASVLDKSVKSGLIHRNKAANKKARLSAFVNKLQ